MALTSLFETLLNIWDRWLIFKEAYLLLKGKCEELAHQNPGDDNDILRDVMVEYDAKLKLFAFIDARINCLVPGKIGLFTGELAY